MDLSRHLKTDAEQEMWLAQFHILHSIFDGINTAPMYIT